MAEKKKGFDLAEALKPVSKLETGGQSRKQLEYIDIDLIDPDPNNRKIDGIEEMIQNLHLVGLLQPLEVRPNPDNEGRYIAVSGHRRREAIRRMVADGEEDWRYTPCLVDPLEDSPAMRRLKLLSGNIVSQALTSAEMAQAAKDVEDSIYQLQEEGHEFPGKIRDYVAKTCGIAASRVGRLKVIREGLADQWKAHFEEGSLVESSAYELARLPKSLQVMTYEVLTEDGKIHVNNIPTWKYSGISDTVKSVRGDRCKKTDGGHCERSDERVKTAIKAARWADCANCCSSCHELATCKKVCGPCHELAKKKAEEAAALRAKEAERKRERQEEEKRIKDWALKGWINLGKVLASANMSIQEFAEREDLYWDDEDISMAKKAMRGVDVSKDWPLVEDHPMEEFSYLDLVDLADKLCVSIDYLLCRTDIREMAKTAPEKAPTQAADAGELRWIPPTEPPKEGQMVVLAFDFGSAGFRFQLGRWEDGGWCFTSGTPTSSKPAGWFPLPSIDDEMSNLGTGEE